MSATAEVQGVFLSYVAREIVQGTINKTVTKFDNKLRENVQKKKAIEEPIIVFFPNGTSQVMSRKIAEGKGFFEQPTVINLGSVNDQTTPAGRYKHALQDRARISAWKDLEQQVINTCIEKSGHPLSRDCLFSDQSIYFDEQPIKQEENA